MKEIQLDVQVRERIGSRKIKKVRREDAVPAIVYGGDRDKATAVQVDRRAYERIMRHHIGQNVVFHLNVMEGDKKLRDYSAIVKEEQHEPVSFKLLHLDFLEISLTEEIEVNVAVEPRGEAVGVKQGGGSIDQPMWELDVICLPTNIPEKLEVQIDHLEIGDAIHVKDIKLPAGVRTEHDPEATVLACVPPMKEEEMEAAVEGAEPEVIGKKEGGEEGKEEGGEEGAKKEEES